MDVKKILSTATPEELKELERRLPSELESRQPRSSEKKGLTTYTDGASRGNPGPAGAGVLLFDQAEKKLLEDFKFLGVCTNNEAEYRALLLALHHAEEKTTGPVNCYLDSELTVRQLNGEYAVKSEKLMKFRDEVQDRVKRFESVTFTHVPREHPKLQLADRLANKAIDQFKSGL